MFLKRKFSYLYMKYALDYYETTLAEKYKNDEKLNFLSNVVDEITADIQSLNKNDSEQYDFGKFIEIIHNLKILKIAICYYGDTHDQELHNDIIQLAEKCITQKNIKDAKKELYAPHSFPLYLIQQKIVTRDYISHIKIIFDNFAIIEDHDATAQDLHNAIDTIIVNIKPIYRKSKKVLEALSHFLESMMEEVHTQITETDVQEIVTNEQVSEHAEQSLDDETIWYIIRRDADGKTVYLMKMKYKDNSPNPSYFEFDRESNAKLIFENSYNAQILENQIIALKGYHTSEIAMQQKFKDFISAKSYIEITLDSHTQIKFFKDYDSLQQIITNQN